MKKVILIPYNSEEAGGKPIEAWSNFNLFRTGNKTTLKNWESGIRVVLYDVLRGLVAEFNLLRIENMKDMLSDDCLKKVYDLLVQYPLYPLNMENMSEYVEEYPLHLFYDNFRLYPNMIPIEVIQNKFKKDLRQQNGIIIDNEEDYNVILKDYKNLS